MSGGVENPILVKNYTAGGAIPAHSVVAVGATEDLVIVATADADGEALGVLQGTVAKVTGDSCDVILIGIAMCIAKAAFADGIYLAPDDQTAGNVNAAITANTIIGKSLEAATAEGHLVPVLLAPQHFALWA